MKSKLLTGLFLLLTSSMIMAQSTMGQKDIGNMTIPINQRVILNFTDHVVYAEVLMVENKVKVQDDLYYFWYSANDVKMTRGGFDGKLLHDTSRYFVPLTVKAIVLLFISK